MAPRRKAATTPKKETVPWKNAAWIAAVATLLVAISGGIKLILDHQEGNNDDKNGSPAVRLVVTDAGFTSGHSEYEVQGTGALGVSRSELIVAVRLDEENLRRAPDVQIAASGEWSARIPFVADDVPAGCCVVIVGLVTDVQGINTVVPGTSGSPGPDCVEVSEDRLECGNDEVSIFVIAQGAGT